MGTLFKAALGFVIALSFLGKPLPWSGAEVLSAVKTDLKASRTRAWQSLLPHSGTEHRAHRLHP